MGIVLCIVPPDGVDNLSVLATRTNLRSDFLRSSHIMARCRRACREGCLAHLPIACLPMRMTAGLAWGLLAWGLLATAAPIAPGTCPRTTTPYLVPDKSTVCLCQHPSAFSQDDGGSEASVYVCVGDECHMPHASRNPMKFAGYPPTCVGCKCAELTAKQSSLLPIQSWSPNLMYYHIHVSKTGGTTFMR